MGCVPPLPFPPLSRDENSHCTSDGSMSQVSAAGLSRADEIPYIGNMWNIIFFQLILKSLVPSILQ